MRSSTFKLLATFAAGVAVSLGVFAVRARAAGIPDKNALTYTGYLESPDGQALSGTHSISVRFWANETTKDSLCTGELGDTELVSGRFQVPLPDSCAEAVKTNPSLFVDVLVDGASLGRTKVGAVPYAIEANHATSAAAAGPGAFAVPGKLEAAGDVTVAGKLSVGLHFTSDCVTSSFNTTCTCGAGEVAIGGSILPSSSSGVGSIVESRNLNSGGNLSNKWSMACKDNAGTPVACQVANVICARLAP